MTVSVIMVSYFTGPVLVRSVEAALAAPLVVDVVLVDNGNPSAVVHQLKEWSEREPRLTLLSGHGNIGFAAASNQGAKASIGETLLFLNPDAVLGHDAVEQLLKVGQATGGRLWSVGPRLVNPDGTEQQGGRRDILTPWNAFVEASRLYKLAPNHPRFRRFNSHEAEQLKSVTTVPCLSGAAFMVPRPAFQTIDGFDEGYFLHVEDIDFFLRFGQAGGRVLYAPQAEVTHYKSSSRVDPLRIERLKKQSLNRYFALHYTGIYPRGFLTLLRGMLWLSFGFRFTLWRAKRWSRFAIFSLRNGLTAARRAARFNKRLGRLGKRSSADKEPI
ncbi:MAG: glycosyltransferase family 2 protein [Pseudomonadota bacterium]